MTRFARAKGSKASNERVVEEATSWTVMKQQLLEKNKEIEDSKKRMEAFDKRNANYKAFLQEKEDAESKKSEWANLDVDGGKPNSTSSKNNDRKATHETNVSSDEDDEAFHDLKMRVDKVLDANKLKIKDESDSDVPPDEESAKKEIAMPLVKLKKSKKKKININSSKNEETCEIEKSFNTDSSVGQHDKSRKRKISEGNGIIEKRKKSMNQNSDHKTEKDMTSIKKKQSAFKPKKPLKDNLTPEDLKKIEKKKQKRIKQLEKKKKLKAEQKQQKEQEETEKVKNEEPLPKVENAEVVKNNPRMKLKANDKSPNQLAKSSNGLEKRKIKIRDKEEHMRKKPLLPHTMFINGQELEIDYVDGFPVKKEDALRLKKLRREMISKGLPRSEINQSLKLERRKAEKAFAREKKKVCFNCRKSGHNLSECPELGKDQVVQTAGSGICFKCGSTEHTHFECKVVKGQEFKFAQCFICQEQGHIARQCPDNARGLYPKGGACKVCGDVTHLKRDCPKFQAQQQALENTLRVETVGFSNPDVLETSSENKLFPNNKKQNKIIKF